MDGQVKRIRADQSPGVIISVLVHAAAITAAVIALLNGVRVPVVTTVTVGFRFVR